MNIDEQLPRDLARVLDAPTDYLSELRRRLAAAADSAGILDVAYTTTSTPVGLLLLAATEQGLVRVAFAREDHDLVLQALSTTISPRVLHAPARLDQVVRQLGEYFEGHRQSFDVAVDWRLSSGFRSTVLHQLPQISYGATATYAAMAQLVGSPRAVRAVGSACATNPLPVVVPCHRVVRSDGGLGGYIGGLDAKRALLTLEAAA
jgi:methylated-DNA-[protein]-cysteine S-methyltransferase